MNLLCVKVVKDKITRKKYKVGEEYNFDDKIKMKNGKTRYVEVLESGYFELPKKSKENTENSQNAKK